MIGYIDTGGKLVGENSGRQFDTDRVTEAYIFPKTGGYCD